MSRQILFNTPGTLTTSALKGGTSRSSSHLSKAELELRLRMKRSAKYIQTMTHLDAGGHCQDPKAVEALVAAIQEELPEVAIEKLPIGIVSRCHLGGDYEVHTVDRTGNICQHYKRHESLPSLLEAARGLATHPQYIFVEVYVDSIVAVRANGEVALITQ